MENDKKQETAYAAKDTDQEIACSVLKESGVECPICGALYGHLISCKVWEILELE